VIARFRPSERSWGSPVVAAALAVLLGVAGGVLVVATSPVVVLAALAGLGVAFVLLQSLQLGLLFLFALLVLLPFAVIPVNLGAQLTVLDATLTALLLVWLLRLLARREALDLTPAGGLLLGFLGLAVAAFVNGSAVGLTPEMVRRFLKIINSTLLFFTIVNVVRDWGDLRRIVRALVLSGGLAALIGIVLYFLPRSLTVQLLSSLRVVGYPSGSEVLRFLPGPNDTYTDTLRATSTSIDPNVLGGTLILVGALIAAQWFARRPVLPRPALAVVGLLVLACMVLTYSRSSWVGLAAAVAWLGTFRFRRAWLLGFGIVTALSVLPIGQEMLERLLSGLAGADKAAGMRLGEYKDALRLIARYPVLGVGFGGSPDVDLYVAVSSIYLLIAEQMGLLGLAAFLAVLATIMVHATRGLLAATDPELKTALSGLQAALVGALVAGLFDHYFLNLAFPHSVALFWGYAGLLMVAVRLARPNRAG
jgi:O-antigen ligase